MKRPIHFFPHLAAFVKSEQILLFFRLQYIIEPDIRNRKRLRGMQNFTQETTDFIIEYKTRNQHSSVNHFHDTIELVYLETADIMLFVKDNRLHLHSGDLLFINEFEVHRYLYNPEASYVRFVINFKKDLTTPVLKTVGFTDPFEKLEKTGYLCMHLNARERQSVQWRLQSLLERQKKRMSDPSDTALAAIRLELSQILLHFISLADAPQPQLGAQEAQICRVIQFIDAHYDEEITLERLQQEMYLNKFRIAHLFKELTGFTVIEYIQHRRVIEAQKKLLHTRDSVTDIGIQCGFNSVQHFCRVFRKFSHTSPAQYRRQRLSARPKK